MKYVSFEVLWKFSNFLKFLKYWNFFETFSTLFKFIFFFLKFYKIFEILNFFENFDFFWNFMTPLPMVYRTHDILILPTHGILTPLPMVFWHPYPWYIELLPWYFDTPTMCRGSIYHGWGCQNIMGRGVKISGVGGVKIPLPMVFWPPTHGILTLLPMVYRTSIHGILTPIPMVFWPPLSWRG